MQNIDSLAQLLQGTIAPCILFSGIGFFLLMLGNTLPRPAELIRQRLIRLQNADPQDRPYFEAQVQVLFRRCRYLQWAIAGTTLSMLCIFIMITCLFFQQFYNLPMGAIIKTSFLLNKIVMIIALFCYFQDVRLKLWVIKSDIERTMQI